MEVCSKPVMRKEKKSNPVMKKEKKSNPVMSKEKRREVPGTCSRGPFG